MIFRPIQLGMVAPLLLWSSPSNANPVPRFQGKQRVPSLKSAIVRAIQLSGTYNWLRRGEADSTVSAVKRANGSVEVHLGESEQRFDVQEQLYRKNHDLLVVCFSSSGTQIKSFEQGLKLQGAEAVKKSHLCRAAAAAYSFYNPSLGSHTSFQVEAQEKPKDIPWQGEGKLYRFYVRILPREPGASCGYALSKGYKLVATNPGT